MARISASEVKRVITALRDRRERGHIQANRELSAQIDSSQRKAGKRLQSLLAETGLDVKKLEPVLNEHQRELRRILEKRPTPSSKSASAGTRATVRKAIDARVKTLELANTVQPHAASTFVVLDAPFLVFANPSNWLFDSHVSRKESFAKVRFQEKLEPPHIIPKVHDVTFVYVWENPSEHFALVNVETYVVLKGFCLTSVQPRIAQFLGAHSRLSVHAGLTLLEWWNQPPTTPLFQKSQEVEALGLHAYAPFLSGDTEDQNLFDGYDLKYSLFAVPPKGVAVFYVNMFTKQTTDGHAFYIVDFLAKDSLVLCPYVQLEVLTAP